MAYVIIVNEDYVTVKTMGCFENLTEAEAALGDMQKEYDENDIIGYDDEYLQLENDYGNIITYQIIFVDCEKKD